MPKPLNELLTDKADKARERVMKRYFDDFCQCKTLEERSKISVKIDVLRDVALAFGKEVKEIV